MANFVCIWRQSVPVENLWKTIDSCGKLIVLWFLWFLCVYYGSYDIIEILCVYYDSYDIIEILCVYYGSYVYIMNLMFLKYTRFLCDLGSIIIP